MDLQTMVCIRIIITVLSVYMLIVYISSPLQQQTYKPVSDTKTRAGEIRTRPTPTVTTTSTSTSITTVKTNSPPYYDFIYKSEELCSDLKPYVLILITSAPKNRQRRDTIRYTWGRIAREKEWPNLGQFKGVKLIFLLGEGQDASLNSEVLSEAKVSSDMMIGGFSDTYRNLTLKVLMGFKWMKTFCPGAQYVMKTDDDSFLDIPKIINRMKWIHSNNTILGSYAEKHKPIRDKKDKYYVSETEYPKDVYPPHVKGCMYAMTRNLALDLLNASQYFEFLSMEDVFITGVLAEPFHVNHLRIPDQLYDKNVEPGSKIDVCTFVREGKLMAHNVDPPTALLIWKTIENQENCRNYNWLVRFH